jgi:group I intron endonuclease
MTISGIYEIVNKINGHRYIGSSINIERRWSDHLYKLNNRRHENQILMKAWNKYGENLFQFNILAICPKESLLNFEQVFLNEEYHEYNISDYAHAPTLGKHLSEATKQKIRGYRHTEEAKKKMSLAKKGVRGGFTGKHHTDESNAKNRLAHIGNKYCFGKKLSEEHKRKISEGLIGYKHTEETRQKLRNKKISEETRKKLSVATTNYWMRKKQILDCEVVL